MFGGEGATEEESYDAMDDWYDRALAAGFGFKSEEEKQEYIKSIGDPMKHPLFAQTTEDLEGHPLTEAFRVLREEDKTLVELAEMYKEEGNQWIKKSTKKDYEAAFDRYSHALTYLDKADKAREDGTECTSDSTADLKMIRSQILSNRALSSLNLTNYGRCYKDCDRAIYLWPGNLKAHLRKCKALYMLKKYPDCIAACKAGLELDATNKDLLNYAKQCDIEYTQKRLAKREADLKILSTLTAQWSSVWNYARNQNVTLGYPQYGAPEPKELRDIWTHLDMGDAATGTSATLRWPVLLQYPQYGTYDVLSGAGRDDMLVEHLGMAFPEKEDCGPEDRIEWDVDDEYHVSNLAVYVQLHSTKAVTSENEWLEACMEQRILLQGGNVDLLGLLKATKTAPTASTASTTVEAENSNSTVSSLDNIPETTFEKLKSRAELREKKYWETLMDTVTGKTITTTGPGLRTSSARFLEVHLGCTIGTIAKAHSPAHVLPRGVLTLLIYPKDNRLHKLFVEQNKGKIVALMP